MTLDDAVIKTLQISTAHIPQVEAKRLEQLAAVCQDHSQTPEIVVYDLKYGFLVPTTESHIDTPKLNNLLNLAKSKGCAYLHLDCDATQIEDLPAFQW